MDQSSLHRLPIKFRVGFEIIALPPRDVHSEEFYIADLFHPLSR